MLLKFIKLCVVFILIGAGILLYNQPNLRYQVWSYVNYIPGIKDVKGVSTDKATNVAGGFKSDINEGVKQAQKEAMNLRISDVMNIINRGQKIASDFRGFQEYVKKEIENFGK